MLILLGDSGFVLMLKKKNNKSPYLLKAHTEVLTSEFSRICFKKFFKKGVEIEETRMSKKVAVVRVGW